jgi:hypothetical protein
MRWKMGITGGCRDSSLHCSGMPKRKRAKLFAIWMKPVGENKSFKPLPRAEEQSADPSPNPARLPPSDDEDPSNGWTWLGDERCCDNADYFNGRSENAIESDGHCCRPSRNEMGEMIVTWSSPEREKLWNLSNEHQASPSCPYG